MDSILAAINEYRILLGAIVLTLITFFIVKKYWEEVSFFALRVWANVPFIGKIARLSQQPGRDNSGWFNAEKDICSEFQPYFQEVDKSPQFYDACKSYLQKAGELGRKELSFLGWCGISVMVFIEAMGFSYVLAGYTIPGASEALQQQGAIGIALLISGLLVFATHATGHELHKNTLVKKIRTWWSQSDTKKPMEPSEEEVQLENNHLDDGEPAWQKILNRVDVNAQVKPSYIITTITLIAILAIGSLATYVRGQVLETEAMDAHSAPAAASAAAANDPYSQQQNLPAAVRERQAEVDVEVEQTKRDAVLKGGWATFIALAVIFFFLQIVGIIIGFKTGFAGKESAVAYKFIGKFNNREQFTVYHERKRNVVAQIAQRNLIKLQSKMADKLKKSVTDKAMLKTLEEGNGRTFLAYAEKVRKDHDSYHVDSSFERRNRDERMAAAQSQSAARAPVTAPEPQPKTAATSAVAQTTESQGFSESEIEQWMDKLGWDRERTIELLVKQREKKAAEQRKEVSEEEALRMLEESNL